MKKKIGLLLAAVLLTAGCGKIPTLKNGEEAVVTFENGDKISVDDLYEEMKDTYALQTLITMIDKVVLENTFPDYKEEAQKLAETNYETMLSYYDSEDELLELLRQYYGIASIEAYKNSVYLSYMQNHATEEYAKSLVTDAEAEKYYEDEMVGDVELAHILIVPEVTDKMTDEEIENAESAAKATADSILKELKNTKAADLKSTFEKLAKENSSDEATKDKGGNLGRINKIGDKALGSTYDDLTKAAYNMEDGTVYDKVIKTEEGYHIIYKVKSYDKAEFKTVKKDIVQKIADNMIDNDSTIHAEALANYRKKAGMDIQDSELQTQYGNYITNQLQPQTNN